MITLSPEFPLLKLITSSASNVDVTVVWNYEGKSGREKTQPQRISSATTTTIFSLPTASQNRAEIVEIYVYSIDTNTITLAMSDGTNDFRLRQVDLVAGQTFSFVSGEIIVIPSSGGGGGGGVESFETVNKNLLASNATFSYSGQDLSSVSYSNGITKTFTYGVDGLSTVVLSGATPGGIDLTKTLNYTLGELTGITYS